MDRVFVRSVATKECPFNDQTSSGKKKLRSHQTTLFLFRIKGEKIGNLLLDCLSFFMQTTNVLCHDQDLTSKFFLELFNMG